MKTTILSQWTYRACALFFLLFYIGTIPRPSLANINKRVPGFVPAHLIIPCSAQQLITAITAANNSAGADILELTGTCTYTLTLVNNDLGNGPNSLPVITSDITINGNGATIARSTADGIPEFRLFQIASTGVLTLDQLTLTNSRALSGSSANVDGKNGGAIYNAGHLALNNTIFSYNSAGQGGDGIFFNGPIVKGGDGGNGGAIYNANVLNITQSAFIENAAGRGGYAGCWQEVCANPGQAGAGGAIYNDGTIQLTQSTLADNAAGNGGFGIPAGAGGNGGAIASANQMTITASTFKHNRAGNMGPANLLIYTTGGHGGAIYNAGSGTLGNLTFDNNQAGDGNYGDGNYADGGNGGGIANIGGILTANNLTLNANAAGDGATPGSGGAIANTSGTLTLTNSIVANSARGGNCFGTLTNGSNNLDSDGTCNFGAIVNPQLDPNGLQDNGGPTQTIALQNDSTAINAGNNAVCAASPTDNTDQRGIPRPQGKQCDIGAVEMQTPSTPLLLKPPNKSHVTKAAIRLKWTAADRALYYRVTIRQDAINGKKISAARVTDTTYKTPKLERGHWYYWKIRACSHVGCTNSHIARFYINP